ncbi:MAG: long-chain fatty acid--CoA ligase [Steroidobacteraceae bacterium]
MLAATAARVPAREALVCGGERLSYARYLEAVGAFARELLALGCRGQRVALVMGNGIDICIATFAVHAAGAQAVPLNPLYTGRELGAILEDADVHALVHDVTAAAALEPLLPHLAITHRIVVGVEGGRRLSQPEVAAGAAERAAAFAAAGEATLPEPLPDPDSLATLQYTGGTTGRSKGVNMSHRAMAINIAQREALLPIARDEERMLCCMPLFHTYAAAMCLHNAAHGGATLVILPRFTPEALFELLTAERITILAGSPSIFTALLKHEAFASTHFDTLRMSYSGSAALPEALLSRWESATGAPVLEGYGQSESGPVLSFNPLHGVRKAASVGLPLPQTQIQIVDPVGGTEVYGPRRIGEIRARGPQVMVGYRNRPEETAQALRDGWLYTGDLGELDEQGYLYIRDRKKDMVLVSGFNVYPREVEEVLGMHPAILEVAVLGVPDEQRGARIKAFVVFRPGLAATSEQLDAHCRANLAGYKVPREYVMLAQLPKTGVGKIDKKQLR